MGAEVFSIVGGAMQKSGYPDRYIAIKDNYNGFVEFKEGKNWLTALQLKMCSRLWERGTMVCVVRFEGRVMCSYTHHGKFLATGTNPSLFFTFTLCGLINERKQ